MSYTPNVLTSTHAQIQRKESAYEPGAPNAPLPGTRTLPWTEQTANLFQLGAVLGCAAVRYGYDKGARRVELLAIRENEKQHSRCPMRYQELSSQGHELSYHNLALCFVLKGTELHPTIMLHSAVSLNKSHQ